MSAKITESQFKGKKSIVIESNQIRVTILPYGARTVSMFKKDNCREFLMQQEGPEYRVDSYAGDYVGFIPCGFDDMFPTINECFYESYPWKGHIIPDHGEVWGLNWQYKIDAGVLKMHTHGIRLPYRLEKSLHFTAENKLRIDYTAENPTEFDMDFLWVAHPMLKAEKGMEFHLPPDCTKAVSVLGLSHRMGGFGEEFDWPVAKDSKGFSHQLNKLGDPKGNIAEKYYFKNRLNEGWIKIKYPSDNSTLTLNFPSEKVPYVGILVDEGWWKKDLLLITEVIL